MFIHRRHYARPDLRCMTGFLMSRILRHKRSAGGAFTTKYRASRLVYSETFQHVETAIRRETEIKKWRREKK